MMARSSVTTCRNEPSDHRLLCPCDERQGVRTELGQLSESNGIDMLKCEDGEMTSGHSWPAEPQTDVTTAHAVRTPRENTHHG